MTSATLYHGGVRGRYRGDLLLPPSRTGAPSLADFGAGGVCSRDHVYLTSDLLAARVYACMCPPRGRGWVYEVEPVGILEADPDYSGPDESWQVPEARVVRIVERNVERVEGLNRHQLGRLFSADDPTKALVGR